MNVKNLFNRAAVAVAVSLPSFVALAQETGGSTGGQEVDATEVGAEIVSQSGDTLINMLNAAAPVILSVIGAGLAVWAGIAIVGVLKKAFGAGKGR